MFTPLGIFIWLTILFSTIIGLPGLESLRVPFYLVITVAFGLSYIYRIKISYLNLFLVLFATYPLFQFIILQGDLLSTMQAVTVIASLFLIQNFVVHQKFDAKKLNTLATLLTIVMFGFYYNVVAWNERSAGLFGNPNTTAYMAVTLLPIVLMFSNSKLIKRVCSLNVLSVVILTGSRGALLALIFGTVSYYLVKKYKLKFLGTVLLSILAIILSSYIIDIANYIIFNTLPLNSYNELRDNTRLLRLDSNSREDIYLMATEKFFSSNTELIGLGFENAKFKIGAGNASHAGTHNSYLEVLLRLGFIGLFLFICYLIFIVSKISRIKNLKFRGLASMQLIVILSLATNASLFLVLNYYFFYLIIIVESGIILSTYYHINHIDQHKKNNNFFSLQ